MIYPSLLILTDFLALLTSFTVAYIVRVVFSESPLARDIPPLEFIKIFLLILPMWLIVNAGLGLYSKSIYEKRLPEAARLLVGSFIGILTVIGYDFVQDDTIFPARIIPVYGFFLAFILLFLARNILWMFRTYMFRYGYGVRNVMIIGSSEVTINIAKQIEAAYGSGYKVAAIVCAKQFLPEGFKGQHFSNVHSAIEAAGKLKVHTIIQTEMYENEDTNRKLFASVRNRHMQYKFIPAQAEFYTGKNTVELLLGYPVISVHQTPLIGWGRVTKRLADVSISLIGIVLAAPILLVIALLRKLNEPKAPIFYRQRRVTRFGTEFGIYKFRTMNYKYCTGPNQPFKDDEAAFEAMGRQDLLPELKEFGSVKDDPRVSKFSHFLRRSSIDELPQLLNVLKGELSIVGPRPMTAEQAKEYRKQAGGDVVLSVKGGITGLWQVSGRNNLTFDERINLELYYVQNWTPWLDLKIIIKTFRVVLGGRGTT